MEQAGTLDVLVVGGTGFLGYHAVLELLRRGHRVTALALDLPVPDLLPPEVAFIEADLSKLSDEAVKAHLAGRDGVVFAAGIDDRVVPPAPAYDFFHKHNVESTARLFRLAREAGVKRGVVCSSYFAYFERTHPEWGLADHHPYIRARREQSRAAIEAGGDEMTVCVLELPYIFGSMPGRRPLWAPLIDYLRSPWPLFFPRGGTNMVSVDHVAEAIAGALEQGETGRYPVGDENLTWRQWLERLSRMVGRPRKVRTLPTFVLWLVLAFVWLKHRLTGKESGLQPTAFVRLQTRRTYLDVSESRAALGFGSGGLDDALRDTVAASMPAGQEAPSPRQT